LKRRDRRAYAAEELPVEALRKIAKSGMARRHYKLDRLLDKA
jgi:hypothetical protein